MKRLVIACLMVTLAALAGCKDEQTTTSNGYPHSSAVLYYTYPMNGQVNVAPHTPIVLTYMDQIAATKGDFILKPANGPAVAIASVDTVTDGYKPLVKGGTSLVIHPAEPLDVNTKYVLTSKHNAVPLPQGKLTFTVRPALRGAVNTTITSSTFKVASLTPDGSQLPVVDFSTFDVVFSQPLKVQSVQYGTNVMLKQGGNLVPATVLVNDRKMTIDPDYCLAQPEAQQAQCREQENGLLKPGVPVTISLTSGIKSVVETGGTNESLQAFSQTVTPKNSAPRAVMVQKAQPASTNGCDAPDALKSALTGMSINCVPVRAKLLGDTTTSGQQGDIYAQLAFAPHFPKKTPLRIKKGALLQGTELAVNIGGHVPAGFSSGDVTVTFLSDANGYLLPNPYTDDPSAPKRLIITSDMAFDTADPRANGAFTQNLLHVTLIGSAIANPETGILKVDAVGIVEPSVLGIENAYGVLSFHMESYPDQANLPVPSEAPNDSRTLKLIAWVPGTQSRKDAATETGTVPQSLPAVGLGAASNVADLLRPGDPLILTFNKPLDVTSVVGGDAAKATDPATTLVVKRNGTAIDFTWDLNGTALVIQPTQALRYSTQQVSAGAVTATTESTYTISYTGRLTDLAGKPAASGGQTLTFTMPVYADVNSSGNSAASVAGVIAGHSPVVTAIYPGFPCATDPSTLDLAKGEAGTCIMNPADGSTPSGGLSMPIMPMPANRSIHVVFSQEMKADTIRLPDLANSDAGTFRIERCESTTSCNTPIPVEGQLTVNNHRVLFTPEDPWVPGDLYRYTLVSDNLAANGNVVCSATGTSICSVDERTGKTGHPLKTAMLDHSFGYNMGGPDMQIYFTGAPPTNNVLQLLQQYPVADVDASFKLDPGEPVPYTDPTPSDNTNHDATLTDKRAEYNAARIVVKPTSGGGIINFANVGCGWVTNGLGIPDENKPLDCKNAKYTFLTGALMADIVGFHSKAEIQSLVTDGTLDIGSIPPALCGGVSPCPATANIDKGAVLAWIYPTQLAASNLDTYARALGLLTQLTPTGTQVMRIRYTCDANLAASDPDSCSSAAHGRVPGWIIESSIAGAPPQFVITLNVYMDAPNLEKAVGLFANSLHNYPLTLNLQGPLTFLPDGRLQIRQVNTNPVGITIDLGGVGKVNLQIPVGGTKLNYVGTPIEN